MYPREYIRVSLGRENVDDSDVTGVVIPSASIDRTIAPPLR